MSDYTIPVIDLEVLSFTGTPIDVEVFPQQTQPIEITVGMTLPGPQGIQGPAPEIYYGTTDPDPALGNDGALYIKYID